MGGNLYVVKRCETRCDEKGLFPGCVDSNLTYMGTGYAYYIRDTLKNFQIDMIVHSGYCAARQTADIINQVFKIPVCINSDIRNRYLGGNENKKTELINLNSFLCKRNSTMYSESMLKFTKRVYNVISKIIAENKEKNILMIVDSEIQIVIINSYLNNTYIPYGKELVKLINRYERTEVLKYCIK